MAKIKKTIKILSALLVLALFNSCANQQSPSGGEVDKIPPAILESTPKNGTVNFKGKSFEITFSEYVDKRSVQENIFISPKIQGSLEFDWSGRTVEVIFPDSLKKNTTYSITIGGNVTDLRNNNKMNEAFNLAFSTGNIIDSCKISGKVYEPDPSGILIFAYRNKGTKLNIAKDQPDYISQVGKTGQFEFNGLGMGNYHVFALKDKLQDYVYNEGDDRIGIPTDSASLTKDSASYKDLNFFMTTEDTTKPHLKNVVMTDRNHLAIEFTKAIDSTKLHPANFSIIDSTSKAVYNMKYFYKGQGKPNQFFLAFSDSIKNSSSLYLIAKELIDLNGNKLAYEANSVTYTARPDTSAAKILKISGQFQDLLDYESPEIFVQFDDGFDNSAPLEGVSVDDNKGKPVKIKINMVDNSSFNVTILDKVKPKSELTLKLNQKLFKDITGKSIDSLYKKKFSVINDLDFSGAVGNVAVSDSSKNVYVVLEKAEREKKVYKQKTDKKGNFDIKKVVPGKYLLWSFIDADGNTVYSKGKVNPLTFSEKFKYYPDTLNLRARWPVGDIKIQFEKK